MIVAATAYPGSTPTPVATPTLASAYGAIQIQPRQTAYADYYDCLVCSPESDVNAEE